MINQETPHSPSGSPWGDLYCHYHHHHHNDHKSMIMMIVNILIITIMIIIMIMIILFYILKTCAEIDIVSEIGLWKFVRRFLEIEILPKTLEKNIPIPIHCWGRVIFGLINIQIFNWNGDFSQKTTNSKKTMLFKDFFGNILKNPVLPSS